MCCLALQKQMQMIELFICLFIYLFINNIINISITYNNNKNIMSTTVQ